MDDGETAADGLDFTPPDTPSQHYQPGTPMDGAMGNSPSKDDAGAGAAAAGSQGGSQMSQPEDTKVRSSHLVSFFFTCFVPYQINDDKHILVQDMIIPTLPRSIFVVRARQAASQSSSDTASCDALDSIGSIWIHFDSQGRRL